MIGKHINLMHNGTMQCGRIRTIQIIEFETFTAFAFHVVFGANEMQMFQYNVYGID